MLKTVVDFKYLAPLVFEIKAGQLTGVLNVSKKENNCQLFFHDGQLVNAVNPGQDEVGDGVLYDLLNWTSGELEWQPQSEQNAAQTIDEDQRSTFLTTLSLFQKQGKFEAKTNSSLLTAPDSPPTQTTATANTTTRTSTELQTAAKSGNFSIFKPLLLLPGESSFALQQQINNLNPMELVAELQRRFFSGYVTYTSRQTVQTKGATPLAMLLFENGELTSARYTQSELEIDGLNGQAAFDAIVNSQTKLAVDHIVGVEKGVVTAFRGLVEGMAPYSKVPATQNNYNGLLSAFARQQRSGVIHVYMDKQVEVYYMLENGRKIASFGPQPLRPLQLRVLNPDLNSFWNHPNAFIDVYLTAQPEQIDISSVSFNRPNPVSELTALLSGSLLQLFELVCQFTTPKSAFDQLLAIAKDGSHRYPLLGNAGIQLVWNESTGLPQLSQTRSADTSDTIAAYEYLLNAFLKPYIEKMGLEIFRQLAELALGENANKLSKMGFRLDFLSGTYYKSPITDSKQGEVVPASGNWQEEDKMQVAVQSSEESAFDF